MEVPTDKYPMAKVIGTTCGVLVTDGELLLICHPTKSRFWDIPKGKMEPGEDQRDTAARELMEETGVIVDPKSITDLGVHDYKATKRLHLFLHRITLLPDVKTMICVSMFDSNGERLPEMDGFRYEPYHRAIDMVNPSLGNVLRSVLVPR